MTNEQMLVQIGIVVGETVRRAVQESEARLKVYVDERLNAFEQRLTEKLQEVGERLSAPI